MNGAFESVQVTNIPGNNQLLYFTSSSVLADGSGLVYISDCGGSSNLHFLDFQTGQSRQLTAQNEGYLCSYVYFDGSYEKGFGKASVSLDSKRKRAYYIQGLEVHCVDTDGNDEVIERLPNQQMTGFTHISDDGRFLCIPTVDADAFNVTGDRAVEIDRRVQQHGLSSYLRVIDLQKGSFVSAERVMRGWVTHVQFRPGGYEILYNHEWCADCGIRRMWYFDGAQHRPLRRETAERSRKDWTCHEMWQSDGRHVIYHGTYANGIAYIGRVDIRTGESKEIALPSDFQAYGHFTIRNSGLLVTDGYWREPSDELGKTQGRWISVLKVDWENSAIEWHPLCLHNSSWNCQCSHPHPIFDESESFVYFTSDHSGKREVYRVAVPQGL